MIFGIYTISGHSMLPFLSPGEKVIVSGFPYFFKNPKKNDIVLFQKDTKTIIKRIVKIKKGRYVVRGDNLSDSAYNFELKRSDIIGKYIYKF